ncbi:MAG: DUF2059 domain-containing protein [Roseibium sp.]
MKPIKMYATSTVVGAAMMAWGAVAGTAHAQDAYSESHIAAAKNVAVATKILEPFDDILPLLAEQTKTAFIQVDPARAEEVIAVTQNVALKLAPQRAELNQQVYEAWAAKFSEAELKELADFYNTPLGTKLRDSIPNITAESVGRAKEWQDKISTEMVTLVQEELTKGNTPTTE